MKLCTRRMEFIRVKQAPGEKVTDLYRRLDNMEKTAFIKKMEPEDWWIQHFIASVQDQYFVEKLLELGEIKHRDTIFKKIVELERHQIERTEIWGARKAVANAVKPEFRKNKDRAMSPSGTSPRWKRRGSTDSTNYTPR